MYYGYARVSTREQNLSRQTIALKAFGVDMVFCDKESGKDFNRIAYQKMMQQIKSGDVLVIKSIDRLGRNYDEVLQQWRAITKDRGADIVVLDMPLLDTRKKSDEDLTGTFICDLVLQILSYVADLERSFIRQRQAEGIIIAKEKGVKFGRPSKNIPDKFVCCKEQYLKGYLSSREAAAACGLAQTTFLNWIKKF